MTLGYGMEGPPAIMGETPPDVQQYTVPELCQMLTAAILSDKVFSPEERQAVTAMFQTIQQRGAEAAMEQMSGQTTPQGETATEPAYNQEGTEPFGGQSAENESPFPAGY